MKLRKLTVQGFKSFADKTVIEFDDGVTGIVGPNGCGKSNVVDAFKWVLGEQSARSLRGKQMMDVIFSGSGSRKAMGMAEVTLTFDNTDGTLARDETEVSVTRRLYRSGESDYLLNGKTSRLKDIRELFMDTGVGVDAYSLIEQGRVDVLLKSSPKDRREIFEEAAGISKYRARRKEAQRKLENVDQNLLRLGDIVDEVEKQLRSVKLQAGKARSYQHYQTRLTELRAQYSMAEYHRLHEQQQALASRVTSIQDDVTSGRSDIDRLETERLATQNRVSELNERIRQAENNLVQTDGQIASVKQRAAMSRQRMRELEDQLDSSQKRSLSLRHEVQQLQQSLSERQAEHDALEQQASQAQQHVEQHQQRHHELSLRVHEKSNAVEDEKAGLIDLLRQTAQLHNEIKSLDVESRNLDGQREKLHGRASQIEEQLQQWAVQRNDLQDRLEHIDSLIAEQQQQLEARKQRSQVVDNELETLANQLQHSKEQRSALQSRRDLLVDMESKFEGIDAGVRWLLERKQDDPQRFGFVAGMVADLIQADVAAASVIEAALGPVQQYIVASDRETLMNCPDLAGQLTGRVSIVFRNQNTVATVGHDWTQHEGVIGMADTMVTCDAAYEPLARHLLGTTVVVRDLKTALYLSNQNTGNYRFVTEGGSVIEVDGTLRIGPMSDQRQGLISRRSELRDLNSKLEDLECSIDNLSEKVDAARAERKHLDHVQQELRTAIYESNTERVETSGKLNSVRDSIKRLTDEQPVLRSELEMIDQQLTTMKERSLNSQKQLAGLEEDNRRRNEHVETMQQELANLQSQRDDCHESLTQARVHAGQVAEKRLAAAAALRQIQQRISHASQSADAAINELSGIRERIAESERTILDAESALAELYVHRQTYQGTSAGLRIQRGQLNDTIAANDRAIHEQRQHVEQAEQQLHDVQLKSNEMAVRIETLCQRTQEELDIDLAAKYAEYEVVEQDWGAVESEIAELRGKLQRLGNVNLDAIDEQEQLEIRQKFLSEQRDDLIESQKKLSELIRHLDQQSTELFLATFEAVRAHFQELFRKLFGGGKADIILEEPDIPLESGIDIIARPPGKESRSISLLSGGEKTMTAVSLLMAVFKSRPSPFCILDEVDAALDDANIERFNNVVREFLDLSQFIIITHAKRTMSIANILYGITMQEAGVSKRISVSFRDKDTDQGEQAVA